MKYIYEEELTAFSEDDFKRMLERGGGVTKRAEPMAWPDDDEGAYGEFLKFIADAEDALDAPAASWIMHPRTWAHVFIITRWQLRLANFWHDWVRGKTLRM